MEAIVWIAIAALIFAICRLVDKAFTKLFRSKAQHMSGLAVRANKRYGVFGVVLSVLGLMAVMTGYGTDRVLLVGGALVAIMGVACIVHYLSFGIFYDGETFLVSSFAKKSKEYSFGDIQSQKLYLVTGGNIIVELQMAQGDSVSLQSTMDGVFPFLDTAFAAWCRQTGRTPEECDFYDPSKSWWFPHGEEN